jgi:hypothetical protein
MGMKGD